MGHYRCWVFQKWWNNDFDGTRRMKQSHDSKHWFWFWSRRQQSPLTGSISISLKKPQLAILCCLCPVSSWMRFQSSQAHPRKHGGSMCINENSFSMRQLHGYAMKFDSATQCHNLSRWRLTKKLRFLTDLQVSRPSGALSWGCLPTLPMRFTKRRETSSTFHQMQWRRVATFHFHSMKRHQRDGIFRTQWCIKPHPLWYSELWRRAGKVVYRLQEFDLSYPTLNKNSNAASMSMDQASERPNKCDRTNSRREEWAGCDVAVDLLQILLSQHTLRCLWVALTVYFISPFPSGCSKRFSPRFLSFLFFLRTCEATRLISPFLHQARDTKHNETFFARDQHAKAATSNIPSRPPTGDPESGEDNQSVFDVGNRGGPEESKKKKKKKTNCLRGATIGPKHRGRHQASTKRYTRLHGWPR